MRVALYVPCYNGAAWLGGCLETLLAQSRPADEVAVVDDGSTDGSASIARSFAPRVRLIQHGRNRGLAAARNTALAELGCDVLASVDADVFATSDWLRELLGGFESPRTAAVGGKLLEARQTHLADRWRATHMAQHAGDFPLRNPPVLPGANAAVRREIVRALGGYDESFRTNYEDADLQHRLIERGYHCRYVPDAVAYHQRTDTPLSVLRTFWGWLRPPAERAGLFASVGGLTQRRTQTTHLARRALWQDFADGQPELGYLSLLVALMFPLADAHHAALRADERGDLDGARHLRQRGAGWWTALRHAEPALPEVLSDVESLTWWPADRPSPDSDDAARDVQILLNAVPTALWAEIRHARARLAADEGWPRAQDPRTGATGASFSAVQPNDVLAVIEHGPKDARERLLVTRTQPREEKTTMGTARIAAHRIGWLPASPLQQSLLCTGRSVWGDRAALAAVPAWRPEQIDPRRALDELRGAERRLTSGDAARAAWQAAGALLVARRAYTAFEAEREAALAAAWPEAPSMHETAPVEFVRAARSLIEDWFYVWEANGPTHAARTKFERLRALAGSIA